MNAIKNAAISAAILEKMAGGMNVREALDAVCGEGAAAKMISELYEELRAKAGK